MTTKHFVPAQIDVAKHQCNPENARQLKEWLATRGGLAIWESQDLGDPGKTWTTPVKDAAGQVNGPPHWKCGGKDAKPKQIITDIRQVEVVIDREVERFRIKVKRGSGLMIVLNDASSKRVRDAEARIGKGAYHTFDHDEAIILAPEKIIPLAEFDHEAWKQENPNGG